MSSKHDHLVGVIINKNGELILERVINITQVRINIQREENLINRLMHDGDTVQLINGDIVHISINTSRSKFSIVIDNNSGMTSKTQIISRFITHFLFGHKNPFITLKF